VSVATAVADRYAAAQTDSGLVEAALWVEQLGAVAYAAAAGGPLAGAARVPAQRFAVHEQEHAAAFATMLLALTVPVSVHAGAADVDALMPAVRDGGRRAALAALAELEGASIAGHQTLARRLRAVDIMRTAGMVSGGAAQHLVVLRSALGQPPTRAFENGL